MSAVNTGRKSAGGPYYNPTGRNANKVDLISRLTSVSGDRRESRLRQIGRNLEALNI
eukprot:CAMPEP_0185614722 /NCGR_PEP_ID=MMETSP0436-20130131/32967_1 /TAXON_ID=626734 ORGANISM="Favella taraikaensis, Strain Fe Narragansett Bay" /NCGR_SAMPLE_ID=MMETSP0436 /ASSEMBLY_ACC=CAM_ASM_000390 /LENGTH=56 /DNA_ID=CAMNT_0028249821 /DNA_START=1209 /DNA_END=1379 /DNA_ORIENTATION=-